MSNPTTRTITELLTRGELYILRCYLDDKLSARKAAILLCVPTESAVDRLCHAMIDVLAEEEIRV